MNKLFFNKGISINDLSKGTEFYVDDDEVYSESEDESYFDDDTLKTFKDEVAYLEDKLKPKLLSGSNEPFSVYKERMIPVTEDRKVLKEIMKCGTGLPMPDKSVVMMHYDAYLENQKEPFDSTRLRKKPWKFLCGDSKGLPGFELAIQTMKKDELSRFLVSPDYAYGELGIPPRIPPSAEILYEIEILSFHDSKEDVEFEDMPIEDQRKVSLEKVVAVYNCESDKAKELFKKKLYKQAIARYRRVANKLQDVNVANEEEDYERNGYLLTLYLNLAQCYINIETPNKAIVYADLALKIDRENIKGLYRMGYALYMIDDYERAEYYLKLAKKVKPFEKCINDSIARLERKKKQHLERERTFCKKMFNNKDSDSKERVFSETDGFIDIVREQVHEFLVSDEKELAFSPDFTEDQIEMVKVVAMENNLAFVTKVMYGQKITKIAKKLVKN